ncbi:MAG: chorismate synthase, partial [Nitrososphaerales archaeon]
GIHQGHTTGAPICMMVYNKDVDSRPYDLIKDTPRPGHADYTAGVKYDRFNDARGGGRFSARITAGFVMSGAIAKKLLKTSLNIEVLAYTREIGDIKAEIESHDQVRKFRYSNEVRCPDSSVAEKMREQILKVRKSGDSLGGIVEGIALNLPVGIGEPVFGSLDSEMSKALFSIPAVKGVEFGSGFGAAKKTGSTNNDQFILRKGKITTSTNNSGGILGGISSGMPLVVRISLKPTSSIAKKQKTVNLAEMKETDLIVPGRHDPCVVPRAVPVVESVMAIVLADLCIRFGIIPSVIPRSD